MRKVIGDSGLSLVTFVIFCEMARALATFRPFWLRRTSRGSGCTFQRLSAFICGSFWFRGLSRRRPCGGGLIRVHSRSPLREIFVFGLRGGGADRKLCI
jgi:hypothetical protein